MKCDELKAYKGDVTIPVYGTIADAKVYLKEKADEAITELKASIADLEGLNHDLCERVTENDGIRQHWEEIEQTRAENERLKAKLVEQDAENERLKKCEIWMKQHFFCEEVIACESAKNRKLKRALWLSRAERAHLKVLEYWPDYCHNAHCRIAEQKWDKVERKCLAMAEKFK